MDQNNGVIKVEEMKPSTTKHNQQSMSTLLQSLRHKWEVEPQEKYTCKVCSKTFYNAVALQNHRKAQHDFSSEDEHPPAPAYIEHQEDYATCDFKFIPSQKKKQAKDTTDRNGVTTRVFTEDTTYLIVTVETDETDVNSAKKSRLEGIFKKHQMKSRKSPVHIRGPFTCTFPSNLLPEQQCGQIFFNCCQYSFHYRDEHTKRRKAALRCQVCEKRLNEELSPRDVVPVASEPRLTFPCRLCSRTFHASAEFEEHNRVVHAKLKPHQCSICSKRFTQQSGLQQHLRMHAGVKPFVCTYCPKAFTQKAGLEQHLRTHTKVKPFKCVICTKSFSQSVHLRQHMRTHTNIQPFKCSVCAKRFKQSSHLNFHMRSHLVIERYANCISHQPDLEYLNLANLKPVQDGETVYYAAEFARYR